MTSDLDTSPVRLLNDDELRALAEIMFLAAAADGEFSDVERRQFDELIDGLSEGRLSGQALQEVLDAAATVSDEARFSRLRELRVALPDEAARRIAVLLAVQLTAADGVIRTSERELICDCADVLEIDRDEVADFVRAVER